MAAPPIKIEKTSYCGKYLAAFRAYKLVTQHELAKDMGVNARHIWACENGKVPVSPELMVRIAHRLRFSPVTLLNARLVDMRNVMADRMIQERIKNDIPLSKFPISENAFWSNSAVYDGEKYIINAN